MKLLRVLASRVGLLLAISTVCTGCSTSGGSFSIIPSTNHRLTKTTERVRDAIPTPQPYPRELDMAALPAYIVEPGDVLLVQSVKFDSPVRLPTDQTVLPDGTIDLGRYGHLPVAGNSLQQIESEVNDLIRKEEAEAGPIDVRLVGSESKVFYVLGEVNAPGFFPYAGHETVLDAIVTAGGLSEDASKNDIFLARPTRMCDKRIVLRICYDHVVRLGDTSTNYQIVPGDRIYVGSQSIGDQLFPYLKRKDRHCCMPQIPDVKPRVTCPVPSCCEPAPCDACFGESTVVRPGAPTSILAPVR